jgi:DNA-binding transcriptional ArsR family regulator
MARTKNDTEKLERAAIMLKAMAHPTRMAIVDLIVREKELTVTEIYERLNLEQAVASQHLAILKDKDVLAMKRDGKNCYYQIAKPMLKELIDVIMECQVC